MQLDGRTAVITGAASGIGRALALGCAQRGMSLVLADVEEGALKEAEAALAAAGARTLAVRTDVSSATDLHALADQAYDAFGDVGLLCNNAGVSVGVTQRIWELSQADWEWLIGVNQWGVIHGLNAFLPRMMAQDQRSHVLNTASAAALIAGPVLGAYKATKHAVLSISETLYHDLEQAGANVGVSVFCPDVVATRLREAARNRPEHLSEAAEPTAEEEAFSGTWQEASGLPAEDAAKIALEGVEAGRFYLLTDPWALGAARERLEDFEAGMPRTTVLRDVDPPSDGD